MRLFFAYRLPEDLRAHYREFQKRFDPQWPLRWLEPEHWHITTLFLGSAVERDRAMEIGEFVCSEIQPIQLEQYSFKKFPRKKPNMIWADYWKTDDFSGTVERFHKAFGRELQYDPYPHSTLCRARRSDLDTVTLPEFELWGKPIELEQIDLWNSRPGDEENRFEILKSWELKRG